jgi:hypothetical protein
MAAFDRRTHAQLYCDTFNITVAELEALSQEEFLDLRNLLADDGTLPPPPQFQDIRPTPLSTAVLGDSMPLPESTFLQWADTIVPSLTNPRPRRPPAPPRARPPVRRPEPAPDTRTIHEQDAEFARLQADLARSKAAAAPRAPETDGAAETDQTAFTSRAAVRAAFAALGEEPADGPLICVGKQRRRFRASDPGSAVYAWVLNDDSRWADGRPKGKLFCGGKLLEEKQPLAEQGMHRRTQLEWHDE